MHRIMSIERRTNPKFRAWVAGLVTLLVVCSGAAVALTGAASAQTAAPVRGPSAAPPATVASATPSDALPCAYVTDTICVSAATTTEPDIVPSDGQFTSAVEPANSTSILLDVKSEKPLNGTTPILSGVNANVALNVSATLWNGDQYYSPFDGTVWHSATAQDYVGPLSPTQTNNNQTYPWWYQVEFAAKSTLGTPIFQAGMSISWSIAISVNVSNQETHNSSPTYHFTYAGAWPSSPYPGSAQFVGAAAFGQDVAVRVVPTTPNWNDSLQLNLRTTTADATVNASIENARVLLSETTPNGTPLLSTVIAYAPASGSLGVQSANITIPATFNLDPNSTVEYSIAASDYWGDTVVSAPSIYIVGGNGSFQSTYFADALNATASPGVIETPYSTAVSTIGPGVPVNVTVASIDPQTALNTVEALYVVDLPQINSGSQGTVVFHRTNSTSFWGTIPAMPVGAVVGFELLAWDFHSTLLTSSVTVYSVESFSTVVPTVPVNGTFFYVGVYDAGAQSWLNDASYSIVAQSGFIRSVGTTTDGLAYPNATGQRYYPLVVPAGVTYNITVTPAGKPSEAVSIDFTPSHVPSGHFELANGPTWSVVQEGDLLIFYLNSTAVAPSSASPATNVMEIATIAGLAVAAVTVIPLVAWWSQIQRRREEEVKRVTL